MKQTILTAAFLVATITTIFAQAKTDTITIYTVPGNTEVTTNANGITVQETWSCDGHVYTGQKITLWATNDTVPVLAPCPSFETAVYGDGQSDKGIVKVFYNSQNKHITFGEPCELGSDEVVAAYEIDAEGKIVRYLQTRTHLITIMFSGNTVALRCEDNDGRVTAVLHN